ncbi:type IVB secretion system protein IcmH/DotU [Azospirillum sp. ST 5-10]|uniref:type IVB secretion system protein IcmH/DotU n=1 Tax=unclassified Azospirillum TaxID=2630922 RepID=UPI003F4A7500
MPASAGRADVPADAALPAAADGSWPAAPLARAVRNPLLGAAAPLLDLAGRLRDLPGHPDPDALRDRALAEVRRFEAAAAEAGVGAEEIRVGRFALCATLDDVVLATDWGPGTAWAGDGLVAATERDAAAGDRFYDLLDTMLGSPHLHRNELELFYACLSLGFEGKHRTGPRGGHALAHLRDRLFRLLRRERAGADRALSPAWRGAGGRFRPLARIVPVWTVGAVAAVLLLVLYLALARSLADRADPVAVRLAALLPDRPVEIARLAPPPAVATPALAARIAEALAPEIRSGAVAVLAGDDGALVVGVRGIPFPAESDELRARHRAVVERIGETLAAVPGPVLVLGHGDGAPVRTLRFAGVRELSEARGRAVAAVLERHLGAGRVVAEGRGDDGTADRRVDILLYPR